MDSLKQAATGKISDQELQRRISLYYHDLVHISLSLVPRNLKSMVLYSTDRRANRIFNI